MARAFGIARHCAALVGGSWNIPMPFAPQTAVVDANNPGRIGITTGRQIGAVMMAEVHGNSTSASSSLKPSLSLTPASMLRLKTRSLKGNSAESKTSADCSRSRSSKEPFTISSTRWRRQESIPYLCRDRSLHDFSAPLPLFQSWRPPRIALRAS